MDYATFTTYLKAMFVALYPPIASEEWKGWSADEVKSLNTLMHLLNDIYNVKLRPQYDQTFYRLAKETQTVVGLKPVRKETVRTGSDSETPSPDDIFASLLGKTEATDKA
jgi:hypothetical protein